MRRYVFIIITLLSVQLYADQAAWITKAQAERGAALIRNAGTIRHYCEPCGDKSFRREIVHSVTAVKAAGSNPGDSYFEVLVNGSGIDLAYVYTYTGGKWVNVAMQLNIPVEAVSRILSDDLPDERFTQESLPSEENIEDYDGSADFPLDEGE